ncbi:MAG: acetyl-CoA C-acyltransferase, partial [Xanthobacteraceae bacterium]
MPGLRTPFVNVDGPFAKRDALTLSVPVVQAMAQQASGPIDFGVWGSVVVNLAYANLAREIWLESKLDPHVPTFTTIMQCSTSMVGVFEAAGILDQRRASLAMVGGVESMTRAQFGLSEGLSVWLRRLVQARSAGDRLHVLGQFHPSDVRLHVPKVQNRVTHRSMGEHTED